MDSVRLRLNKTQISRNLSEGGETAIGKPKPHAIRSSGIKAKQSTPTHHPHGLFRSWKDARSGYEAAQQEKTIDTLKTLGLVFGAIIGLGLFSQVPIGQEDLQKYQDIKGSASRIDLGDLNN